MVGQSVAVAAVREGEHRLPQDYMPCTADPLLDEMVVEGLVWSRSPDTERVVAAVLWAAFQAQHLEKTSGYLCTAPPDTDLPDMESMLHVAVIFPSIPVETLQEPVVVASWGLLADDTAEHPEHAASVQRPQVFAF